MWQKESNHIGLKILLVVVIIVLVFALYKGYTYVSTQNKAQDAALIAAYNQKQEQAEVTTVQQASAADLTAAYQADLDCVAKYLPGIVCWGDVLTAGTAGGVSYPDTLQGLIDIAINDKYDFKSTLTNASNYSGVIWENYTVDIPVVNMGSGEETTDTILGRNGAVPFIVSQDFVIPADSSAVSIQFTSQNGDIAEPLTQGNVGMNPVIINGIEGRISLDLDSKKPAYLFTRSSTGNESSITAGTEIITAASSLYRNYIPVIFMGTYGGYDSVQELISQQKAIINHQVGNSDRYIVIGLYYLSNLAWNNGGSSSDFEKYETAMIQEYGDHFINLRKYLISDGLSDANITQTSKDKSEIDSGRVPPSLKSTSKDAELNAAGYRLLGRLVFDRMDKLGYFNEVKDELGITALEKLEKRAS